MYWVITIGMFVTAIIIGEFSAPIEGSFVSAIPFLAGAIGAQTLAGLFSKGPPEGLSFGEQRLLQRDQQSQQLRLQQFQFGESALGREQQQGFFDVRRGEIQARNEAIQAQMDRLFGQKGQPGISQQDQDRLTQQNNLQVTRNVGALGGQFSRFFGGNALKQPEFQAALVGSQVGQKQRFGTGLQTQSINIANQRDSEIESLMAMLRGQQRTV